jgi:hypothetical protein
MDMGGDGGPAGERGAGEGEQGHGGLDGEEEQEGREEEREREQLQSSEGRRELAMVGVRRGHGERRVPDSEC